MSRFFDNERAFRQHDAWLQRTDYDDEEDAERDRLRAERDLDRADHMRDEEKDEPLE